MSDSALLEVTGLTVEFRTDRGWRAAIRDVSFTILRNEVFGLVGESGSGKSVTALAVPNLLPRRDARISAGSIKLDGAELVGASGKELNRVRGKRIGMIFQEPMTSLNPSYTVGEQIAESLRRHLGLSRRATRQRVAALLDRVGIPRASERASAYPHEFSGGMRQRVMIAMALSCGPDLLIADEPTTALDVTVQARILDLLRDLQQETGMSVLLITHDLGVVAQTAHRVGVLYGGEFVEMAPSSPLFAIPRHPYTSGLLQSVLTLDDDRPLQPMQGSVPGIDEEIAGCRFAARCEFAEEACRTQPIVMTSSGDRAVRCRRADELSLPGLQ